MTVDTSEEDKATLQRVKRQFESTVLHEKDWRHSAKSWFRYFHGDQLSADVLEQMRARSQPPIKFNLVKTIVNLLTGQEIQGRTDVQFLGVGEEDELTSTLLTEIYRQQNHADDFQYDLTQSFQDGVICGRGVIFEDWCTDEDDIIREHVPWKEVYVDPASKKADFSDARYIFRVKWVDLDVAQAFFPEKEDILNAIVMKSDEGQDASSAPRVQKEDYFDEIDNEGSVRYADSDRSRVKLIETFWKKGAGKNQKVFTGVFCQDVWLSEPEEYDRKHNSFPFIFTYYERDAEDKPYGLLKDLVDPQDVLNRMLSKSMHILGTKQVLAEKGALKNTQNVQTSIARPDAVINDFEDGALSNGKVIINDNRSDAGLAFQHFEVAISAMHRISGVNPELQGLNTNARSGTAISMRMRQGNTVLTKLYDCLEKTKKNVARLYVYLMAQYISEARIARYKDPLGSLREVTLNGAQEELIAGVIHEFKINKVKDIFKYDIAITEGSKSGNQNEAEFTQLVELFKAVPQAMTPAALAELIKSTHLPNKEELAKALMPPSGSQDATATHGGML